MDLVEGDGKKFDAIELYSCFPCVPKMARRTLGLGPDVKPTVTGGLTFFGAPLNTYMTHAAVAMVRKLRAGGSSACSTARAVLSPSIMAWCCRGRRRKQRSNRTPASRPRPTAPRARCRNSSPRPRQGQGRELYRDLWRQGRRPARRGDAAHARTMRARWRGCRRATARRWRTCATWTARPWAPSAISPWRKMACRSGGWVES